jgi:hypothetical protein
MHIKINVYKINTYKRMLLRKLYFECQSAKFQGYNMKYFINPIISITNVLYKYGGQSNT